MADVMMQLGFFQFSIDTAAYQEFERSTEYRWASQSRLGTYDALQFVGPGRDSIRVSGVIYPHYKGGLGQIERMRLQGRLGVPLPLVTGTGRVMGLWVVESIREQQGIVGASGAPLRQDFDMGVRFFGGFSSLLPF